MSWVDDVTRFVVITNNYCSFNCWKCNHHQDKPWGSVPYIKAIRNIELVHVWSFIKNMKGTVKEVRLTGGEATCMNPKKLSQIMGAFKDKDIKTGLLTNGWGVKSFSPKDFKDLDYVVLDNHGFNHDHIKWCRRYFDLIGVEIHVVTRLHHYDIDEAANMPHDGSRCSMWLRIPSLCRDVVFPCCNLPVVDGGRMDVYDALRKAGWSVNNPDLLETISDKDTIPDLVHDVCLQRCYAQNLEKATKKKLTFGGKVTV